MPTPSQSSVLPYVNRRIRVFVSSTFRDMVAERDELMSHVWPELRRICQERHVELIEVDLRWGIAEDQCTRLETLKFCLDEIRACRPFFVGILGERYGWVPGADAFTADLREEQPWLDGLHDRSVTELEILHGVLNNPDMAGRAFFYFRDPKYLESMPAAKRADYAAEDVSSATKQAALRQRIRSTCAAKHIPLRENYTNPQQFASLVLADLRSAIETQFPKEEVPDELARDAQAHESCAESRTRTYVGRGGYFETLDRHAGGTGGPLLLLGDSGSGKTALLANWLAHWREAHPKDPVFQHYIGGTPDSSDHWRLMARLVATIKRWTGDSEDLPTNHDELLKGFPVWLGKARAWATRRDVRIILVIDALNQLEDQDHARLLGWLPEQPLGGALRLIASTLPLRTGNEDPLEAARKRSWQELRVQPLCEDERRRMISCYLARFGKRLDARHLNRLASAPAASTPLYLKILLDDLRVTGTYDRLDERLDHYLSASDIPALLRHVLARYQRDYERDRPGLVAEALGLVFAARRGLSETELLQLLRPSHQSQLPLAYWTPLRAALEDSLVDRGGILNFAHEYLRAAVEAAFVSDKGHSVSLRLRLADYFEASPVTSRTCDELPWLLARAGALARLRICVLDIDRFVLIKRRDEAELRRYWVHDLHDTRTMGQAYIDSFERWAQREHVGSAVSIAANNLSTFLHDTAHHAEAEVFIRKALVLVESELGPEHPDVSPQLNGLGLLLMRTNRHAEAEPLLRRALKIEERNGGPSHPHTASALANLAGLLQETNRFAEAEPLFRRALAIDERCYGPEHHSVAIRLSSLASLLQDARRLDEAEPLMRRALTIDEASLGPEHPDIAIRLNNLAGLLHATGRLAEAEPFYRRALEIDEECYGCAHPTAANRLNNLAAVLQDTGRLDEAERMMRRALEIDEHCLPADHPDIARDLNNLGMLLHAIGRLNEAEPLLRRVVEIFLQFGRKSGHRHQHLEMAANNYAALLVAMGRSRDAAVGVLQQIAPELFEDADGASEGDEGLQQRLMALVAELQANEDRAEEILQRVQANEPELIHALRQLLQNQQ